jgi:hypothetical protein
MKKRMLILCLALIPALMLAQVQQTTKKKTVQQQPVQLNKNIKADMKLVKPVEPEEPVDPALTARQKAYNWLAPFKSYHLLTVDQMATLKTLDLSTGSPVINGVSRDIYMCDDSLVHLLALTSLESITLPRWSTNAALAYLSQMPSLKSLGLGDTKINHQGIASLPVMPNVETVILYGTAVNNNTMQILMQKFPGLRVLNVASTPVTDQGLAYLLPNNGLEILMLTRGSFTDACIPTLIQFTGLKTIGIEFTQISAAGRQQLRNAFPNATIIPIGN